MAGDGIEEPEGPVDDDAAGEYEYTLELREELDRREGVNAPCGLLEPAVPP